jgi:beta-mannosidase
VWQDFAFACGLYPAYPEYCSSVQREAEAQVRRLRHHPSLALWCGNNEDYSLAHSLGRYKPHLPPAQNPEFPARVLYERLLPEVLAQLSPTHLYRAGSPWGGASEAHPSPDAQLEGDRHTWEVWHGAMAPYQQYAHWGGRFVSEFGMEAAAALPTWKAALEGEDLNPDSRAFEHHNKAEGFRRRIASYWADNLPHVPLAAPAEPQTAALENYIYGTGLVQAEAMHHAYRDWRRRFARAGRYAVGGALVWQLNDCWPVTSWAVIDSSGFAKPGYYAIRRQLAPLALGLSRAGQQVEVWAVNAKPEPLLVTLELVVWTVSGQRRHVERRTVEIAPLGSTELGNLDLGSLDLGNLDLSNSEQGNLEQGNLEQGNLEQGNLEQGSSGQEDLVVNARLLEGDQVLARSSSWPQPLKHLRLEPEALQVKRLTGDSLELRVSAPLKGLWLEAEVPLSWDDNGLDLFPGDPRVIHAPGAGEQRLTLSFLGGRCRELEGAAWEHSPLKAQENVIS